MKTIDDITEEKFYEQMLEHFDAKILVAKQQFFEAFRTRG